MGAHKNYHVSGSFGILLAVLLFLDDQNIVLWALLACLFHEVGHLAAIRLLGGHVQTFRLSVVGAEITPQRQRLFSYREELLIAAAGPAMSLLLASLFAYVAGVLQHETMFLFAGLNLMAGVFNLLPVGPLDGGRMLRLFLIRVCSLHDGARIYRMISAAVGFLLLSLGVFHLLYWGGNITLLLTGAWLLAGIRHTVQ